MVDQAFRRNWNGVDVFEPFEFIDRHGQATDFTVEQSDRFLHVPDFKRMVVIVFQALLHGHQPLTDRFLRAVRAGGLFVPTGGQKQKAETEYKTGGVHGWESTTEGLPLPVLAAFYVENPIFGLSAFFGGD